MRMSLTKVVDGAMVGWHVLCLKEGVAQPMASSELLNNGKRHGVRNVKIGCKAMMYVALDTTTKIWRVAIYVDGHNHPFVSPCKRRY